MGPKDRSASSSTSVVGRRLVEFAPSLLGPDTLLIDGYENPRSMMRRDVKHDGPFGISRAFVGSPGMWIAGGTDQIQRNIIGDRVLGLPREPSVDRGVPWSETKRN